jgi:hypothetical protein
MTDRKAFRVLGQVITETFLAGHNPVKGIEPATSVGG